MKRYNSIKAKKSKFQLEILRQLGFYKRQKVVPVPAPYLPTPASILFLVQACPSTHVIPVSAWNAGFPYICSIMLKRHPIDLIKCVEAYWMEGQSGDF